MSDYIKREDAMDAWYTNERYTDLEGIPNADVVERKHGQWLITDRYHDFMDGTELTIWKCSECGDEFSLEGERPTKKYCSNCGARMEA